jgi:hypothetical protein
VIPALKNFLPRLHASWTPTTRPGARPHSSSLTAV